MSRHLKIERRETKPAILGLPLPALSSLLPVRQSKTEPLTLENLVVYLLADF